MGMPAVITEQRTFGLDKAHARHCPLCDVGWDGRYQDTCWLDPAHPAVPGAPPLVQFLTVPLPTDFAHPAYATELDPI